MHDAIIIGAGPAGLTAAIYTSRAGLKTLVLENTGIASQASTAYWIENYPGFKEGINGLELMRLFKAHAQVFGAEIVAGTVDTIESHKKDKREMWQVKADDKKYEALSIIIASGATASKLGISDEERLYGKGVSYCATCDGPLFRDKNIVVVGGGNSAAEEALFLTRFASKVILIHRRDRLRAAKVLQEKVLSNEKIEVIWNASVDGITGSEKVDAVKIKDVSAGRERKIPCAGVFISIGFKPNTDFVKDILELDEEGCIVVDNMMQTSKKGIFACGDCRNTTLRQVVTACGDGAFAAHSLQQYVDELKGTSYERGKK